MPQVLNKKALVLLNTEPALDCADPRAATGAAFIVNLAMFRTDIGDVQLPIAPFTETSGTFVNTEGRVQSFQAAVRPLGEARPAWKVLRVLGTMLGMPGFAFDTVEQVREACLAGRDVAQLLSNDIAEMKAEAASPQGVQRIADVPIYFADPLVRHSLPLQKTRDARSPRAWMNAKMLQSLGVQPGGLVLVRQGQGEAGLPAGLDDKLPDGCVRIAAAHSKTAMLGPMFGTVTLERITAERAA